MVKEKQYKLTWLTLFSLLISLIMLQFNILSLLCVRQVRASEQHLRVSRGLSACTYFRNFRISFFSSFFFFSGKSRFFFSVFYHVVKDNAFMTVNQWGCSYLFTWRIEVHITGLRLPGEVHPSELSSFMIHTTALYLGFNLSHHSHKLLSEAFHKLLFKDSNNFAEHPYYSHNFSVS